MRNETELYNELADKTLVSVYQWILLDDPSLSLTNQTGSALYPAYKANILRCLEIIELCRNPLIVRSRKLYDTLTSDSSPKSVWFEVQKMLPIYLEHLSKNYSELPKILEYCLQSNGTSLPVLNSFFYFCDNYHSLGEINVWPNPGCSIDQSKVNTLDDPILKLHFLFSFVGKDDGWRSYYVSEQADAGILLRRNHRIPVVKNFLTSAFYSVHITDQWNQNILSVVGTDNVILTKNKTLNPRDVKYFITELGSGLRIEDISTEQVSSEVLLSKQVSDKLIAALEKEDSDQTSDEDSDNKTEDKNSNDDPNNITNNIEPTNNEETVDDEDDVILIDKGDSKSPLSDYMYRESIDRIVLFLQSSPVSFIPKEKLTELAEWCSRLLWKIDINDVKTYMNKFGFTKLISKYISRKI